MLVEQTLPAGLLERNWEALAVALNEAGPDKEAVFLAKVALALSSMLPDPGRLAQVIEVALRDLRHGEQA
ncbi:DUF2783 domain-containing protein [Pigmentiphaga sp. H8]|uniref:DUF2783 domain-containing protein n=1 Tax=unclassified Pigmentiphaga TaxID=2626614 RepID=UPI000F5A1698|nr:DUF2783 domain-containing protein [Pigmentiphaga sp. H8]AZG06432.1 DUF2783 domain-containing protein [Pigmentiphaga sp. H8]